MLSITSPIFRIIVRFIFFGILLCHSIRLLAQEVPEDVQQYIEDYYAMQADGPAQIDVNMIFDQLAYFLEHPIPLNSVSREELTELQLLDALQVDAFLRYRDRFGPLVDIYELQAIPTFDRQTIRRIQPFMTIKEPPGWTSQPVKELLSEAQGSFYMRYNRFLEQARGFRSENENPPTFEGQAGRIFTRLQYRSPKKFSVGITAEKDPGEAFFAGSNPNGFDYYAYHLFVEKPNTWINRIAIGDYNISLGQGLILHSGFGGGKSAFATNIKRAGHIIRPHSSIAENTFLRGIAADFQISSRISAAVFYSYRNVDANIVAQQDTFEQQEPGILFSSLQNSGLHRTPNEIEDEKSLGDQIIGGRISYENSKFQCRLNLFQERFSAPLDRRDDLYNLFVPEDDNFQFVSVDYTYIGRNIHTFGEIAYNGYGFASLNGILSSPTRDLQFALLHRYFAPKYFSLNANAFGEIQQATNENGLYMGMNWHITGPFRLSAYADVWHHPWLRFNVDGPSTGYEYMLRLQFYKKRTMEVYLQYRTKTRAINQREEEDKEAVLVPFQRSQFRLHLSQQLHKDIEWRIRAEWIISQRGNQNLSRGYLFYNDIIYKPLGKPFSFTSRLAIFNAGSYDSRIYAYENNMLYSFSIPAYFNRGVRAYCNIRWKLFHNLVWEARVATSWIHDVESIGSGWNETIGNTRTELGTQIKYTF